MYSKQTKGLTENIYNTLDVTFPIEGCNSWPVFLQLFQKLFASFSNLFAKKQDKKNMNYLFHLIVIYLCNFQQMGVLSFP